MFPIFGSSRFLAGRLHRFFEQHAQVPNRTCLNPFPCSRASYAQVMHTFALDFAAAGRFCDISWGRNHTKSCMHAPHPVCYQRVRGRRRRAVQVMGAEPTLQRCCHAFLMELWDHAAINSEDVRSNLVQIHKRRTLSMKDRLGICVCGFNGGGRK